MKKSVLLGAIVALGVVFSGCESTKVTNVQIDQKIKYPTVNVKCKDKGDMRVFNRELEKAINAEVATQGLQRGEDLLIRCGFIEYDEGNRGLRMLAAVGLVMGKGTASAQIVLVDKTGQQVGEFTALSSVSAGVTGGDTDFEEKMAKEIVATVKSKFYNGKLTPKASEK